MRVCIRWTAIALLGLGLAIALATNAHAGIQAGVRVGSLALPVNGEGSVAVDASSISSPGLGAWLIDVTYDPSVASAIGCTVSQNLAVCNAAFAPDTVRIAGVSSTGLEGNQPLASVTFRCDTEAATELRLSVQRFVDTQFADIPAVLQTGNLTCGNPRPAGDVNCDQHVNAIDASLILQLDAGIIHSLLCPQDGDVNNSGGTNVIDASLILQFTAGLIQRF